MFHADRTCVLFSMSSEDMAILSILVMYGCEAQKSQTISSLQRAYEESPQAFHSFKLIIYDNSPEPQRKSLALPFEYEYVHNSANEGVSAAYNYALRMAKREDYQWLLLLDQDTDLPEDYISKLSNIVSDLICDDNVAAIVPKVFYKGEFFSPSRVLFGGIHRPIDVQHEGICDFEVTTIGSGVLLRRSFIEKAGGFSRVYWLDCLDHWIFNAIHSSGCKVYVAELPIEHELSVLDYDNLVSEQRYSNILKCETMFMRSYKSRLENYFYLIRLLRRALRLLFTVRNKKYSAMTFGHLLSLVFCPWRHNEKSIS